MPYPIGQVYHSGLPIRRRATLGMLLVIIVLAAILTGCTAPTQPTVMHSRSSTPPHAQQTLTYVAIGASDAFGVGTYFPDRDNWPTVLTHLLGPDVHLVNLGIPGETVAEARKTELPVAIDAHPALVTVWLGVNDFVQSVSVADYEQQLEGLLLSLHQKTHARVFVGNIPDLSLLPSFSGYDQATLRATIAHWNAAVARAVAASGATLVDLYTFWNELASHPEYIASDGFHPSTVGARRLAEVFQSQIAPSLPAIRAGVDAS